MDDKEYYEVFRKDDRNKRGNGNSKNRTNVKQTLKRQAQIEKRNGQRMDIEEEEEPMEEEWCEEPAKKYGNGKPKRATKEQAPFKEDIEPEEEKEKPRRSKRNK